MQNKEDIGKMLQSMSPAQVLELQDIIKEKASFNEGDGDQSLTPEQAVTMKHLVEEAKDDPVPFATVSQQGKDTNISVIGDPNKTEIVKSDYIVEFRAPITLYDKLKIKADAVQVGPYYRFRLEYKDVMITPRSDIKIMKSLMEILPWFMKAKEDNETELEYRSDEEVEDLVFKSPESMTLAMYNVVSSLLGIPDELGMWMLPVSVFNATETMLRTHPEMINETALFFGNSTSPQ